MRHADHRDNARRRPGAAGQPFDLARMIHAHLDDGVLGVFGQAEQGVRHADVVVLVALGLQRLAEGGQHSAAKFLRRRLADTAGDADHLRAEQHTVVGGHADHRPRAVGHDDGAVGGDAVNRVVRDDIFRTVFVRTGGKIVSIDTLAGEADKDAARFDHAAVGHNRMDGDRLGQRQPGQQFIGRNVLHENDLLGWDFYRIRKLFLRVRFTLPRLQGRWSR